MKELWLASLSSLSTLLPLKSKLQWSRPWASAIAFSLSSLCPPCPLEAGLHTTENTSLILPLCCPNFPRASHLTSSEIVSFYCDWHGITGSAPGPLSALISHCSYSHLFHLGPSAFLDVPWICHPPSLLRTFPHAHSSHWSVLPPDIRVTHVFISFPSLFKQHVLRDNL